MPTVAIQLTEAWQEVGVGPALVEAEEIANVAFGPVAPDADTSAFHNLNEHRGQSLPYSGTEKIFARTLSRNPGKLIVTEGL
jgi:hypothetical protein